MDTTPIVVKIGEAGVIKTIKNSPAKISVSVDKQWVGTAKDSVTVKLLADGVVKKAAVLNSASGWRHSFENLRKYDEVDGHEIVYTVEEARIDGYTTGISGSAKDVFIITNTIIKIPTYHCYAPKTGDESNLALWFSIAILSLGTLGVIAFFEKKRKRVKHNDR